MSYQIIFQIFKDNLFLFSLLRISSGGFNDCLVFGGLGSFGFVPSYLLASRDLQIKEIAGSLRQDGL